MLSGYKSYIMALALGAVAASKYLGWLDAATVDTLVIALTGGAVAALRAGISKG
jgi:hypothetical protein